MEIARRPVADIQIGIQVDVPSRARKDRRQRLRDGRVRLVSDQYPIEKVNMLMMLVNTSANNSRALQIRGFIQFCCFTNLVIARLPMTLIRSW